MIYLYIVVQNFAFRQKLSVDFKQYDKRNEFLSILKQCSKVSSEMLKIFSTLSMLIYCLSSKRSIKIKTFFVDDWRGPRPPDRV